MLLLCYDPLMSRKRTLLTISLALLASLLILMIFRAGKPNFRYSITELGMPQSASIYDEICATAINDLGQVVGWITTTKGSQPVVWSTTNEITKVFDFVGIAVGVDNQGEVAGSMTPAATSGSRATRGFIWSPTEGLQDTGSRLRPAKEESAIDSVDYVSLKYRFFSYSPERGLHSPRGDRFNPFDRHAKLKREPMVGHMTTGWPNLPGPVRSLLQKIGFELDLKSLTDINRMRAILWLDGKKFDLNDLVQEPNDWDVLLEATDVNSSGQIVGTGLKTVYQGRVRYRVRRAFLLNPFPEREKSEEK